MSVIDIIKCRVLMPLGQIIVHFPHSMHPFRKSSAFSGSPFCKARIALRKLVGVYLPAEQLAQQEPHARHVFTSGSISTSLLNFALSKLSRLILELGLIV